MALAVCEYCDGSAELNLGELWLCRRHGDELQQHAGGLAMLLELSPEARRALADGILPRIVREDVRDPSDIYER